MAELYATLIVLSITLSLSYLVYSELRAPRTGDQVAFLNRTSVIAGSPDLLLLQVDSSKPSVLVSVQIDNISASSGVLALDANGYTNSGAPCERGLVTFFSVHSPVSSRVSILSDGGTWVGGYWRNSGAIGAGWTEVMIKNGSACSLSVPGGTISSLPLNAGEATTHFSLFLPVAGGTHHALLIFTGGFDRVAFSA
jgi:hypothetical protein